MPGIRWLRWTVWCATQSAAIQSLLHNSHFNGNLLGNYRKRSSWWSLAFQYLPLSQAFEGQIPVAINWDFLTAFW